MDVQVQLLPSSKSCVFASGWNIFVKQKKLKTKDTIMFHCCTEEEENRREYVIEVIHNKNAGEVDEISAQTGEGEVETERAGAREVDSLAEQEEEEMEPCQKKLKLFGFSVA